ncbi:esterase-like activity of phytase family protein [Roseomonas sp. E05]|uniref:esterase-like activity of phytase family protein n=1 Tax=Roseomonas sp. E05 TaxID=3046310 RepID=UPI0024BA5491|nr:esterase-like activity of phytase family protein [Roseomonas sp. E05]MDJ0386619.1 esterase-like activity of phytase family protein [Roseomonas sp. E05]
MIGSRRRALLAGGLALAGLGACAALRFGTDPALPQPPLSLPPDAGLESRGGLLLNRHAIGFGGLSGLHIADDLTLTAISDLGYWLQARLVLDATAQPRTLEAIRTGRLRSGFVLPPPAPLRRDAESLARLPDGTWLVGFERWHHICLYRRLDEPCEVLAAPPPGLSQAPVNGGLESLTVLPDGRWLAITEGLLAGAGPLRRGWIGEPGRWTPLRYRPSPGFVPTDLCALPEGGALVVERRFKLREGGFSGRLLRIPAAQLAHPAPENVLEPEPLLLDLPHENWEGVSCFRHAGRLWVALMADDNEMFFQRGLLLLFTLR